MWLAYYKTRIMSVSIKSVIVQICAVAFIAESRQIAPVGEYSLSGKLYFIQLVWSGNV